MLKVCRCKPTHQTQATDLQSNWYNDEQRPLVGRDEPEEEPSLMTFNTMTISRLWLWWLKLTEDWSPNSWHYFKGKVVVDEKLTFKGTCKDIWTSLSAAHSGEFLEGWPWMQMFFQQMVLNKNWLLSSYWLCKSASLSLAPLDHGHGQWSSPSSIPHPYILLTLILITSSPCVNLNWE